jgi:hypothetical protein
MKRISLVVLASSLAANTLFATPCVALASTEVQSHVDVFSNCVEQAVLAQLRLDPGSRSAETVRMACAAHRAALEPLLGAGARAAVDQAASRRINEVLSAAQSSGSAAPAP